MTDLDGLISAAAPLPAIAWRTSIRTQA